MMRIIICAICLLVTLTGNTQSNSVLYQDDYQKISFKSIDEQYGYILEDYKGMFGGTLVKYHINKNDFFIEELDTILIIDSMLFYDSQTYTEEDSIMLSLTYRINEFSKSEMIDRNLKYIINDSIIYDNKLYEDDDLHRVLIPKMQTPYKLEIKTGYHTIGPFTVTSVNNVSCKIVILSSIITDEFDHGKYLPKVIIYKGKKYNLHHSFIPWD